jgi:ferredoxin-NADP reductase
VCRHRAGFTITAAGVAGREVYVCGPPAMLRQTQLVLAGLGGPPGRVHYDEPDPPDPAGPDGEPPAPGGPA